MEPAENNDKKKCLQLIEDINDEISGLTTDIQAITEKLNSGFYSDRNTKEYVLKHLKIIYQGLSDIDSSHTFLAMDKTLHGSMRAGKRL